MMQASDMFAQITRENVGRQLAIVLDGKVISAPVIQEPIIGGSDRSRELHRRRDHLAGRAAARRRAAGAAAGHRRAHGRSRSRQRCNPHGRMTGAAGCGLVLVFMMVLYRGWGLVANLALVMNVGSDASPR